MTSYTAVGGGQTPSMTVNFKMNITTYGPHNGIFITSGIQQGTSAGFFAAHTTPNGTIMAAPSIPAIQEIPSSLRGSTVSVGGIGATSGRMTAAEKLNISTRSRSTSRSRPTTPLVEFTGRDSPPDEFIAPEKVKLNVFNEERPYVQYPTDLLLNDTKTTTSTIEVFRSKVDRDNPVDYFALPPNPLGSDGRPQLVRAVGPPYESVTRSETRFSDRPELGSTSPVHRVQWGSRSSGLPSSHSPGYGSNYYGSLERQQRPASQTVQTRQSWVDEADGAYQATIMRRQFSEHQEQRLERARSPTPSAGRVYQIPIERDYYDRRPRPLRHTISQPNVFEESIVNRSLDESYRSSRYPDPRLRCARSRSETRSDDYGYDQRPTSGLSNISRDSWSNSVNNIFKLYQTRDCLGNVLYELPKTKSEKQYEEAHSSKESLIEDLSPSKEAKKYDEEMLIKKPILKEELGATSGRKSRVEFIEPELTTSSLSARSVESDLLQTEPSELFLDVPISTPDDFDDTPRKSPPFRHWVETPKKIQLTREDLKMPEKNYAAPVCIESKESVSYIPKKNEIKAVKMMDSTEKVQISQSTTAELAKHGWISPRFARSRALASAAASSLSQKSLAEDEWPMPPPELSPRSEHKEIMVTQETQKTKEVIKISEPTSSLSIETKPLTTTSLSFSESLKAQFSHSPSIAPSPSPKAASSPKINTALKPPLPPSSSLRRPLITKFDTEPRRVLSTSWFNEASFNDSLNSTPSVSFAAQNPAPLNVTVKAEGTTLRLSGLTP